MCGIVGFMNLEKDIEDRERLLHRMTKKIHHRGVDDFGYYVSNNSDVYLGHSRLSIIDAERGRQPMSVTYDNEKYTIVYNGEIYNYNELRKILIDNNIKLISRSDTEMVLKAYILFKEDCTKYFNGIFAFAIYEENSKKIFLARDHIGVKPLFYNVINNNIFFASEIKSLFEYEKIKPVIDKDGICELFGIGPARNVGSGVFKNIYELEPGNSMIFDGKVLLKKEYYKLKSKAHVDSIEDTIKNIRSMLEKSVNGQLIADVDLGLFLSGGIDSSILTAIVAEGIKNSEGRLKTFSVDYIDNDKNFKSNDFQPKRDNEFIELMKERYNLDHKYIVINHVELLNALYEAMLSRDLPSMADIDSSLLLFCKEVKKEVTVALSGEYADEIFCGYPWFYREDALNSGTFPWSINLDQRQNIINKEIAKKIDISDYVKRVYEKVLKDVPLEETDNEEDVLMKKLSYLTMRYFGANLLDRTDRMSMNNSLEVRVPFTDYNLVEYVYNIPWDMKNYNNMEKGILREAFKDMLPEEILNRKKSPYPKTYDPNYTNAIKSMLEDITSENNNKLKDLVNIEYIKEIIDASEDKYIRPWFGQLMTRTQLMAYLIQVDMWIKEYKVEIEI